MIGIDGIPDWANNALAKSAHDVYESQILRNFYDAWEALHSVPSDNAYRKKKELMAQRLTEARDAVRLFDRPNARAA